MNLEPSPALFRLWVIANAEAWFCQGEVIEPVHFWIGCLKMVDPKLEAALFDGGAAAPECEEFAGEVARMLAYLEMDAEVAATLRRKLRARLLRGRSPREFPEGRLPRLHRSESSRRLFQIAARRAAERKEESLTPLHVLESLFEMKLVSLDGF